MIYQSLHVGTKVISNEFALRDISASILEQRQDREWGTKLWPASQILCTIQCLPCWRSVVDRKMGVLGPPLLLSILTVSPSQISRVNTMASSQRTCRKAGYGDLRLYFLLLGKLGREDHLRPGAWGKPRQYQRHFCYSKVAIEARHSGTSLKRQHLGSGDTRTRNARSSLLSNKFVISPQYTIHDIFFFYLVFHNRVSL